MSTNSYDVIVIGAGSGGLTAAVGFKNIGKSVLLIEREHMGGECTNTGCIPSKALLHHAKRYYEAKQAGGASLQLETYRLSVLQKVREKIQEILAHETPEQFTDMGIDVVLGEAVFTGSNTISVADTIYTFKKSVIATGSSPRTIEIDGIDTQDILTNQNVFDQETIPEKLLVIGAGPIGMELGQAFAMLGSSVTIVEKNERFAGLEDHLISPIIEKEFVDMGITILKQAECKKVSNKTALVDITKNDSAIETKEVSFNKILIAVGRVPNIPQGLDAAGIKSDEYGITTNNHHRTSNNDVYAVGDVSLRLKFTHTADDAARHVVKKELLKIIPSEKNKQVPKVTYTKPAIAAVGISYADAIETYGKNKVIKISVPYSKNDRAFTDNATEDGLALVITKKISGKILGVNIIGQSSGEILSFFTLAMENNISLWKINKIIFPYPTISGIIKKISDEFLSYQLGNLKSDIINYFKK